MMKPETINQEILLFTNSSFCNRPFCRRNFNYENSENNSSMEELEKACWDGMLYELLPELFNNTQHNNYIWKTASVINFLSINMGSYPQDFEKQNSLDPYFFLHEGGKDN
ncbi:MAG TPA: hypothetical protein VGG71_10745 [Chitinophagaceae bacterium]